MGQRPASAWQNIWFLARSDLRQKLKERETLLWIFVMPLLFFFFFGEATSGFAGGGSPGSKTVLHVEVPADAGPLAERVKQRLEVEGFELREYRVGRAAPGGGEAGGGGEGIEVGESGESGKAGAAREAGRGVGPSGGAGELGKEETAESGAPARRVLPRRLLRFPAELSAKVERKEQVRFEYVRKAGAQSDGLDTLRLNKALYSTLADLVLLARGGLPVEPAAFAQLDAAPRHLTLDVAPAGKRKVIPAGYQQTVPGTMVMFTLMMMMTACAILLVTERLGGMLRRLAATPITRGQLIAGKWLGFVLLGAVQTGYAMLAGWLLFGMEWGPSYFGVFVVLLAWVMFSASVGLWFGCLARSEAQASGLGVLGVLLLSALGGCWWPIEIVPGVMQDLAHMLPTGWAMSALHGLISYGGSLPDVLTPTLLILTGAALFALLGTRRFRYE
jgi:ABC-2 type transport system permease protein